MFLLQYTQPQQQQQNYTAVSFFYFYFEYTHFIGFWIETKTNAVYETRCYSTWGIKFVAILMIF